MHAVVAFAALVSKVSNSCNIYLFIFHKLHETGYFVIYRSGEKGWMPLLFCDVPDRYDNSNHQLGGQSSLVYPSHNLHNTHLTGYQI